MRKFHLLFFLYLFSFHLAKAQIKPHCGLEEINSAAILENSSLADELAAFAERRKNIEPTLRLRNSAPYVIPVVVHVIHSGESIGSGRNLSEELIQSQIDILNEDFSRQNDDINETPSVFRDRAADTEIQFCLAKVDPDGNPTNGITRDRYINISSTGYVEDVIKEQTSWDARRYLNIWTLDMPRENILGYAFLPTNSRLNTRQDGVVISHERFGLVSSVNRGRTTTHEVGHYLGLEHPWGESDNDGNPIGCESDDGIDDTPNSSVEYFLCPSFPQSSCGSTDMFMNYMDYVNDDCMNLFTEGQKLAMHDVLENERAALVQNAAATCQVEECIALYDLEQGELRMGFEDEEPYQCWVIENKNNDEETWAVYVDGNEGETGAKSGANFLGYFYNEDEVTPADDYIFSPFFEIQAGRIYEVKFDVAAAKAGNTSYPERLEVGASFAQSSDDFFIIEDEWVFDPVDNTFPDFKTVDLYFESSGAGEVSIGFHVFSDANQYALQIDNVSIRDVGATTAVDNKLSVNHFKVYPNPFMDRIQIDLDLGTPTEDLTLTIKNILGQTIITRSLPQIQRQEIEVPLHMVTNGMYFVTIRSSGLEATRKVLKIANP